MLSQTYFCWCIAFMYSTFLWIELWIEIEFKPLNVCIGINIWVEAWRINKAFCMEQPLIITLDSSGLTRYGSFCYKTFPPIGWSSFLKKIDFLLWRNKCVWFWILVVVEIVHHCYALRVDIKGRKFPLGQKSTAVTLGSLVTWAHCSKWPSLWTTI